MVIVRPDCFTVPYTPRGTLSYRSSEDIVRGFGFVEESRALGVREKL